MFRALVSKYIYLQNCKRINSRTFQNCTSAVLWNSLVLDEVRLGLGGWGAVSVLLKAPKPREWPRWQNRKIPSSPPLKGTGIYNYKIYRATIDRKDYIESSRKSFYNKRHKEEPQ